MPTPYDVIIVGAGSAGAVLAARLSEDPNRSVLLLEAGPDYADLAALPTDIADGLSASTYAHDWHWMGYAVEGRSVTYPRGKVTGGSSAVNGIVAIRPVPEDLDEWAELGNDEWSWERCLPFLRKLEDDRDQGGDLHGKGGPIPIVRWRDDELVPLQKGFQQACLVMGYPASNDHNVPGATGVGSWAMNRTGTLRISTAIGYLAPARHRLNLTIRAGCHVNRVLFEGTTAVGLEVESGGEVQQVFGEEIVLSAGALHSPPILLRSGVGPREQLEGLGIRVVHELAGVGQNLKEHPSVTLLGIPKEGVATPGDPLQQMGLRFTATESAETNDMQMYMWSMETGRIPQIAVAMPGIESLFLLCVTLQRPLSAGSIRLAGRDPAVQPVIDINLLAEEQDMEKMVDGVKRAWAILQSDPIVALTGQVLRPDASVVADDEAIREYLRANVTHLVHPVGTCKMGLADDPGAVVDQQGRVHGLTGLRVVDASIMPNIPRGNTNVPTIMIGEKIAEFMRR